LVNGSGPVGDPFGPCHARTVGTAIEVAVGFYTMADHLDTTVLAGRGENMEGTLETIKGARSFAGHTYLEGLGVPYTTHKRAHFHRSGRERMSIAPS